MPATGQRGAQRPHPGNTTGMRFYQQQRDQAAKKKSEDVDWYKLGYEAGFDFGYDAGVEAVLRQLHEAGLDLDSLDTDDKPGEPE